MKTKVMCVAFLLISSIALSFSVQQPAEDLKDIDKQMIEAIKQNNIEEVRELIAKGATLNFKGRSGPLHTAIRLNCLEIAELLVSKGADVNARDRDGKTSLFSAIKLEIVTFLISHGALVNISDNSGVTPLHAAITKVNEPYKVVGLLLEKGAKINVRTTKEYHNFPADSTPLDFAELDNKPDIAELLRSKGANTHAVAIMAQRMLKEAKKKLKKHPTAENFVSIALIYEENTKEYDLALQNYEKGISYAEKNPWVFHHMGNCYEQTGRMKKALEYYQKSIDALLLHGEMRQSYKRLGLLYEAGRGVDRNPARAVEMFRKSAELDDREAQYRLGLLLEKGEGIERNYSEAVTWFRRSSNAGYKPATVKMVELKEPHDPHDDTPCRAVDPIKVEVPSDFHIMYTQGPTHAEWGSHFIIEVSANGQYAKKERLYSRESQKETTKIKSEGRLSSDAVKRIYAKVIGCGFFEMEKGYWNPDVRDGTRELIHVVANGKNHSVVVYYYQVKRFDSLLSALQSEVFKATKQE